MLSRQGRRVQPSSECRWPRLGPTDHARPHFDRTRRIPVSTVGEEDQRQATSPLEPVTRTFIAKPLRGPRRPTLAEPASALCDPPRMRERAAAPCGRRCYAWSSQKAAANAGVHATRLYGGAIMPTWGTALSSLQGPMPLSANMKLVANNWTKPAVQQLLATPANPAAERPPLKPGGQPRVRSVCPSGLSAFAGLRRCPGRAHADC
jgi:hypothetical protein